jgi:hypothetical protein
VIIDGDGPDSTFLGVPLEMAMSARPVEGAIEALATLVAHYEGRVFLVSKCGPGVQKKSLAWLEHHDVYRVTGLRREQVRFCRERSEKTRIAAELGLDGFVDDRLDVLIPMRGQVRCLVHFATERTEPGLVAAPTWSAALRVLR